MNRKINLPKKMHYLSYSQMTLIREKFEKIILIYKVCSLQNVYDLLITKLNEARLTDEWLKIYKTFKNSMYLEDTNQSLLVNDLEYCLRIAKKQIYNDSDSDSDEE